MFRVTRILRADVAGIAKNVAAGAKNIGNAVKEEGDRNSVLKKGAKKDPELYV